MPRVNVARALRFVAAHGSEALQALAEVAVGERAPDQAVDALRPYQQADGGWAGIDPDYPAGVSLVAQTWLGLQWLVYVRPAGADLRDRTEAFLAQTQQPDGGWDEVDAIRTGDAPAWMQPGVSANRLWLTAAAACKLSELGAEPAVRFDAALDYLRAGWDTQARRFRSGIHSHWMALPLFYRHGPRAEIDSAIMAGCRDRLYPLVDRAALDPLDVIAVAYGAQLCDEFAVELALLAVDRVIGYQQADGGWPTGYGDGYRALATVDALFVLRAAGVIRGG